MRAPAQDLGLLPPSERQDQGGGSPAERDAQFRYISGQVKRCLKRGWPALAVDTKQKERVGAFKHAGRTRGKVGQPDEGSGVAKDRGPPGHPGVRPLGKDLGPVDGPDHGHRLQDSPSVELYREAAARQDTLRVIFQQPLSIM